MRLTLAENPSVGLDIACAMGSPQKRDGYVTVGSDTLTWAYRHLVTLASPEQYDPAWKPRSWTTVPMVPDPFQLMPIAKTARHLKQVIGLMQQVDRIVADREGELIFRYIYRLSGSKNPWIASGSRKTPRPPFNRHWRR